MATQVILTASGFVKPAGGVARFYGYDVIVATSAVAINIRDGSATGTIRAVIPASQAAGTMQNRAEPIQFNDGIYVEFSTATGTVGFLFE